MKINFKKAKSRELCFAWAKIPGKNNCANLDNIFVSI